MNWRWGHLFSLVLTVHKPGEGRAGENIENRPSFHRRNRAVLIQPWAEAAEVRLPAQRSGIAEESVALRPWCFAPEDWSYQASHFLMEESTHRMTLKRTANLSLIQIHLQHLPLPHTYYSLFFLSFWERGCTLRDLRDNKESQVKLVSVCWKECSLKMQVWDLPLLNPYEFNLSL